jgi:hypothetical protein
MLERTASPDYPDGCQNLGEFGDRLQATDRKLWERYRGLKEEFRPRLILNRVQAKKELGVADALRSTGKKYLDIDLVPAGHLPDDVLVKQSTKVMKPLYFPGARGEAVRNIDQIVDNLTGSKPRRRPSFLDTPEHRASGPHLWSNHTLPGVNEELSIGGRTLHVQTEDHGPENPSVETQVFQGGRVVFRKAVPYPPGITPQNREGILQFLRRHHGLLVEDIRAGKIQID